MDESTATGPLFDGRAVKAAELFLAAWVEEVANQGFADVRQAMDQTFKHPTPYYEVQTYVRRENPDVNVISDRGIVYGPWLEGTGSRNKTTRFKGYANFRRTAQALQHKVGELGEHLIKRFLPEMG